jgi:amidohydrolase
MFATNEPPIPIAIEQIRPDVVALEPMLVAMRRELHAIPELGFQEHLSAEFIAKKLTEWGINHETKIAGTGIVAVIHGNKTSFNLKNLAIRADMDGLPIQEENDIPYKSRHDGIMHACGHDGHVAIALATAYYLSTHRNEFAGLVKIIFQPAEEGPGGAKPVIEAGVLRDPEVDAIVGLHLWNNLPVGAIGVRSGPLMAAVELFRCKIIGKGGHGAMPHQTVDAILVAADIVSALQTIVSRNVNPLESAVVTVGEFHAGSAQNIIADSASIAGTVRYFNPRYEDYFDRRLQEIIGGICQAYGANYELEYEKLYPPVVNNPQMTDLVRSAATELIETPLGIVPECQTMGGEDMAFFLQAVPGCYFFLGAANPEKGLAYPHHHPRFNFDEAALTIGVEMFVRCVERFCN